MPPPGSTRAGPHRLRERRNSGVRTCSQGLPRWRFSTVPHSGCTLVSTLCRRGRRAPHPTRFECRWPQLRSAHERLPEHRCRRPRVSPGRGRTASADVPIPRGGPAPRGSHGGVFPRRLTPAARAIFSRPDAINASRTPANGNVSGPGYLLHMNFFPSTAATAPGFPPGRGHAASAEGPISRRGPAPGRSRVGVFPRWRTPAARESFRHAAAVHFSRTPANANVGGPGYGLHMNFFPSADATVPGYRPGGAALPPRTARCPGAALRRGAPAVACFHGSALRQHARMTAVPPRSTRPTPHQTRMSVVPVMVCT